MEEIIIPETRGRKPKYGFASMGVGDKKEFTGTNASNVLSCAKSFCNIRSLDWKFRCYTIEGVVYVVRTK